MNKTKFVESSMDSNKKIFHYTYIECYMRVQLQKKKKLNFIIEI